jgi:hypothetical protein
MVRPSARICSISDAGAELCRIETGEPLVEQHNFGSDASARASSTRF